MRLELNMAGMQHQQEHDTDASACLTRDTGCFTCDTGCLTLDKEPVIILNRLDILKREARLNTVSNSLYYLTDNIVQEISIFIMRIIRTDKMYIF